MAKVKVVVGKDVSFFTVVWVDCDLSEAGDKALRQVEAADSKGEVEWEGGTDADYFVCEEGIEEDDV